MIIVMDTNALMIPGKFGLDVIEEAKRIVPNAEFVAVESTVRELENIGDKNARLALQIIEKNKMRVEKVPGETDCAVITYAQSNKGIVFTNDSEMKKKCVKMRVPVMFLRKKKTLALEGLE
ncbi:MAG: hypothetical protein QXO69_02195 [archaeon]